MLQINKKAKISSNLTDWIWRHQDSNRLCPKISPNTGKKKSLVPGVAKNHSFLFKKYHQNFQCLSASTHQIQANFGRFSEIPNLRQLNCKHMKHEKLIHNIIQLILDVTF
jgi:hypothetical protein